MTVMTPAGNIGRGQVLLVAGFFMLALAMLVFPLSNLDIFWHLANGRAMVGDGRIISSEIFSYTKFGTAFGNHEWLAQIILYLVYRVSGADGLITFKVIAVLAALAMLYRAVTRLGAWPAIAAFSCFLMVFVGLHRFTVRPQLFTFFGLCLFLAALYTEQGRGFAHIRVVCAAIALIIWNWLHAPQLALVLLCAYTGGRVVEFLLQTRLAGWFRQDSLLDAAYIKRLMLQFAAVLLLINLDPLGTNPYQMFSRIFDASFMMSYTGEFMPPPVSWLFLPYWGYLGFVALLLALALYRRRVRIFELFILIIFAALSLRYARATAIFALVSTPFVALQLTELCVGLRERRGMIASVVVALVGIVAGVLLVGYFKTATPGGQRHPYGFGIGISASAYPTGAVRFVEMVGLDGRMYNSQNFGGYLAYFLGPERKIFQYNLPVVFDDVLQGVHRPEDLEKWQFDYVIIGDSLELKLLFRQDQWAPIFAEENAIVMVRRIPQNAQLINRYLLTLFTPQINARQVAAIRQDQRGALRLAAEMGVYLSCRRDERIADLFAGLVADPALGISERERRQLLELARRQNGESDAL